MLVGCVDSVAGEPYVPPESPTSVVRVAGRVMFTGIEAMFCRQENWTDPEVAPQLPPHY